MEPIDVVDVVDTSSNDETSHQKADADTKSESSEAGKADVDTKSENDEAGVTDHSKEEGEGKDEGENWSDDGNENSKSDDNNKAAPENKVDSAAISAECAALYITCPDIGAKAGVELTVSIKELNKADDGDIKIIAVGTLSGLHTGFYQPFLRNAERKYQLIFEYTGESSENMHPTTVELARYGPITVELQLPVDREKDRKHSVSSSSSPSHADAHPLSHALVQFYAVFDNPSVFIGPSTLILPGSHAESSRHMAEAPPVNFVVYLDDASALKSSSTTTGSSASVADVLEGIYRCNQVSPVAVQAYRRKSITMDSHDSHGPQHGVYMLARGIYEGSFGTSSTTAPARPTSATTHEQFKAFRGRAGSFQHHGASHYPSIPASWTVPKIEPLMHNDSQKPLNVKNTAFQQVLQVDSRAQSSIIYRLDDPVELIASLLVTANKDSNAEYSVWGVGLLREVDRHPLRHAQEDGEVDNIVVIMEGKVLPNSPIPTNMMSTALNAVSSVLHLGNHSSLDPMSFLRTVTTPVVLRVAVLLTPTPAHAVTVTHRNEIVKAPLTEAPPAGLASTAHLESELTPAEQTHSVQDKSRAENGDSTNNALKNATLEVPIPDSAALLEARSNISSVPAGNVSGSDQQTTLDKMQKQNAQYSPRSATELDKIVAETIAELEGEDGADASGSGLRSRLASIGSPLATPPTGDNLAPFEADTLASNESDSDKMKNRDDINIGTTLSVTSVGIAGVTTNSAKNVETTAAVAFGEDKSSEAVPPVARFSADTSTRSLPSLGNESEMKSKSTFEPSPEPIPAASNQQVGADDPLEEQRRFQLLTIENQSLRKMIEECKEEMTVLRSDNENYVKALQANIRQEREALQRNEDMTRMLSHLVTTTTDSDSSDKSKARGKIDEPQKPRTHEKLPWDIQSMEAFHYDDLLQMSKKQLITLTQITLIKFLDIKQQLERERQKVQYEAQLMTLKENYAQLKQAKEELETNILLQNKYLSKMQTQIAQVETYKSTIKMQEKVIAKMQAVVEAKIRNSGHGPGHGQGLQNKGLLTSLDNEETGKKKVTPPVSAEKANLSRAENQSTEEVAAAAARMTTSIANELKEEQRKASKLQQDVADKDSVIARMREELSLLQLEADSKKESADSTAKNYDSLERDKIQLDQAYAVLQNEMKSLKAAHAKLDSTDKDHLLTTVDRLEAEAAARDYRVQALEEQLNIQAVESSQRIAELQMKLFESEINANLSGETGWSDNNRSPPGPRRYRDQDREGYDRSPREHDDRDLDKEADREGRRRISRRSSRRPSNSPRGNSQYPSFHDPDGGFGSQRSSPRASDYNIHRGSNLEVPRPVVGEEGRTRLETDDGSGGVEARLNPISSIPENTLSASSSKSSVVHGESPGDQTSAATGAEAADSGPVIGLEAGTAKEQETYAPKAPSRPSSQPASRPASRPVSRPGSRPTSKGQPVGVSDAEASSPSAGSGSNAARELREMTAGDAEDDHS
jgi:hypothetical protein